PRAEWRMRLACAWPLLIGLGTLAAIARHPNPLAVETPIKVSRAAVRTILARSWLTVWSDSALRREAGRLRATVRVWDSCCARDRTACTVWRSTHPPDASTTWRSAWNG